MRVLHPQSTAVLLLITTLAGLAACTTNQPAPSHPAPTYYDKGSFDDNGVEPMPNNGNQNFGRRW